jgi:hypothetical protein
VAQPVDIGAAKPAKIRSAVGVAVLTVVISPALHGYMQSGLNNARQAVDAGALEERA